GCGGAAHPDDTPEPPPPLVVTVEEVRFDAAERETARERIAESVRVREAAEHLDLPDAVVDGAPDPDAWPSITVMNDTAHGMVIWMSGACARTIALPPHSQNSVEICEGGYQIAGQITDGNFLPLVGEHDVLENGYQYTFTFYVQVNPYQTRTRRRR
ncbi:MAG: hypothetical protein KC619_27555, partial [Myxococcales bacterium]|nr:hypothetical protein [Myxococcales bacterium]